MEFAFMNLKLIVGSLVIATAPGLAVARSAITNEDAQQLVNAISGDQDKAQAYCDIMKLDRQIAQANDRGAGTDELKQQLKGLEEKLGAEWSALITAYRDVDLNTRAGLETAVTVQTTIDRLNSLCGPLPSRSGRE
jgi:hypothetical protein